MAWGFRVRGGTVEFGRCLHAELYKDHWGLGFWGFQCCCVVMGLALLLSWLRQTLATLLAWLCPR